MQASLAWVGSAELIIIMVQKAHAWQKENGK